MSKSIFQGFLSLVVSLGVIVGVNPGARNKVIQVWQETRTTIQRTVEHVTETASSTTSWNDSNTKTEVGIQADSNTSLGIASNEVQTGTEVNAQTDVPADAGWGNNFLLKLVGDVDTGLNLDLNFWK